MEANWWKCVFVVFWSSRTNRTSPAWREHHRTRSASSGTKDVYYIITAIIGHWKTWGSFQEYHYLCIHRCRTFGDFRTLPYLWTLLTHILHSESRKISGPMASSSLISRCVRLTRVDDAHRFQVRFWFELEVGEFCTLTLTLRWITFIHLV